MIITKILNMTLTASILALTVILIRILFKKIPKKYVCILWAFVAVRLMCPFNFSSSLSVFNLLNIDKGKTSEINYFSYDYDKDDKLSDYDSIITKVDNLYMTTEGDIKSTSVKNKNILKNDKSLNMKVVIVLWLLGFGIMVTYTLNNYIKLKRKIEASIPIKSNVFISDDIDSPFVLGLLYPCVYLPSGLDKDTRRLVIAHETAHLKRLDNFWKILGYMLLCVYWFNPIFWLSYVLFCSDIESACDEKVIGDMDRLEKVRYSEALLSCAMQRRKIVACPVYFGETNVKGRVKNVLRYKHPNIFVGVVASVLCFFFAITFLTDPKQRTISKNVPEVVEAKEIDDYNPTASGLDKEKIGEILNYIRNVRPGSSGASLRSNEALAQLLYFSNDLDDITDEERIESYVKEWFDNLDEIDRESFNDAYPLIKDMLLDYFDNPDDYAESMYDVGYIFAYGEDEKAHAETICRYIEAVIR